VVKNKKLLKSKNDQKFLKNKKLKSIALKQSNVFNHSKTITSSTSKYVRRKQHEPKTEKSVEGHGCFSVEQERKPGRPRTPRRRGGALSMGRYPFKALLKVYLAKRRILWSETTYEERERKFRYLCRVFREMKKQGKIETMNPSKFTENEIYAFEGWMREKSLDPATKCKYRGLLNDFLCWNDNFVYDKLLRKKEIVNTHPPKEVKTISSNEFEKVLSHAKKHRTQWSDQVAYYMTAMYGYLGLRNKELRLADIDDIDLTEWIFWVKHPKGEGRYGKKRPVPVVKPLRPIITEYLEVRQHYLTRQGFKAVKPLFPSIKPDKETKNSRKRRPKYAKKTVDYYTTQQFSRIAARLSKTSGISFQIKTLRASCGQILKDKGASIETVSKFLGHKDTRTTERFYARIRDESMFSEVNSLFEEEKDKNTISRLIEEKEYISGYA
jgi:integrase/recombinase XerD